MDRPRRSGWAAAGDGCGYWLAAFGHLPHARPNDTDRVMERYRDTPSVRRPGLGEAYPAEIPGVIELTVLAAEWFQAPTVRARSVAVPSAIERVTMVHSQERRTHQRYPVSPARSIAWLHAVDRLLPADVVDESEGGVRIELMQHALVEPGEEVVLERLVGKFESFDAVVRHVRPQGDGSWVIGLEWSTAAW